MYHKEVLSNGVRLITHRMPRRQSVGLGIMIRVGGRYEGPRLKGAAHFLEHLLFKGSKKYSCRLIKESIEGVGGSLNAFTSEELTCYLTKLPAAHLDEAFDILSDMVLAPLLLEADVAREKTVILEEIKMYKDLPQSHVHELLDELLWPAQPLGMSITGTYESVSGISRRHLDSFRRNYYTVPNIVVAAAGGLDPEKLFERVRRAFGPRRETRLNAFAAAEEKQSRPQLNLFPKETEQTHLAMGFHGFKRDHPLRYAQWLLHIILGANMSSRLFNEVREKRGLAYEIGTQVRRFQDTGAFIVHAGIDNRTVSQTVAIILKELERIRETPVTLDEFRRAREFYLGQLRLALEDTLEHMLWIGETTAMMNKTYTLAQVVREIEAVTRKDITEAAQRLFQSQKINLALIGPLKGQDAAIRGLLRMGRGTTS